MNRVALFVFLTLVGGWLTASPRWYAPASLRPGSVNEVYAWDQAPVEAFTVEVVRLGSEKPTASAHSFSVNRPLPGFEARQPALKWSAALVALDALDQPGPVTVRFIGTNAVVLAEVASTIAPRSFPMESIPLDKTMTELREKPDQRKDKEAEAIWAVYQKFEPRSFWAGGRFQWPVASSFPVSAQFGDTRQYQYTDGTTSIDYHRGTDFAVPVGTPVLAPAPGTIVLVADRMLTGISVVIEHGPGLYSVYFHLSRAFLKVGRKVQTGDKFALSGATGLVTGPHLHWEVRVGGVPVDALEVVANGLLDTGVVGAVISSIEGSIH